MHEESLMYLKKAEALLSEYKKGETPFLFGWRIRRNVEKARTRQITEGVDSAEGITERIMFDTLYHTVKVMPGKPTKEQADVLHGCITYMTGREVSHDGSMEQMYFLYNLEKKWPAAQT